MSTGSGRRGNLSFKTCYGLMSVSTPAMGAPAVQVRAHSSTNQRNLSCFLSHSHLPLGMSRANAYSLVCIAFISPPFSQCAAALDEGGPKRTFLLFFFFFAMHRSSSSCCIAQRHHIYSEGSQWSTYPGSLYATDIYDKLMLIVLRSVRTRLGQVSIW